MTVENLHDAIGQLPSDLIAKVDEKRSRKPKVIPLRRYASIAACFAVILSSTVFLTRLFSPKGATETAAEAPAEAYMMQGAPDSVNGLGADTSEEAPAAISGTTAETRAAEESPKEDASAIETYAACELPPADAAEEAYEPVTIPFADVQYADTRNIGTAATTSDPMIRIIRSAAQLEELRQKLGYYTMENFDVCVAGYDDAWFENHDLLLVLVKSLHTDGTFSLHAIFESDDAWCINFLSGGPYTGEQTTRFVFATLEKNTIPEGGKLFAMFSVP